MLRARAFATSSVATARWAQLVRQGCASLAIALLVCLSAYLAPRGALWFAEGNKGVAFGSSSFTTDFLHEMQDYIAVAQQVLGAQSPVALQEKIGSFQDSCGALGEVIKIGMHIQIAAVAKKLGPYFDKIAKLSQPALSLH